MTLIGRWNPFVRVGRAIAALSSPRRRLKGTSPTHPAWVIAHRGAAREAPENTIPAFERAAALGADGVETDICVTSDGHFILWHDADPGGEIALARQAGREELAFTPDVPAIGSRWRRAVSELSLEEFRRHYGYTRRRGGLADLIARGAPPDIPISTLDDLFAWTDREPRIQHVVLDVKLEGPQAARALELLEKVRRHVSREGARSDLEFHYLSPHREVLEPLIAHSRKNPLPRGVDVFADFELPGAKRVARLLSVRRVSMGVGQRFWNEFRLEVAAVARAKGAGRFDRLLVWTINEAERLSELARIGVDGILTDDPVTLREIVSGVPERAKGSATSNV